MRELGTRLSFLVIPWVMLAGGASWVEVAVVSAAQLAGYLVVFTRRPLGHYADLASVAVLGGIAFLHDNVIAVAVLAAALGALRAICAVPTQRSTSDAPPREGLIRSLLFVAGLAVGAAAMWLGPPGALWVTAMIFAVSAVLQLAPAVDLPSPTSLPWVPSIALSLFATNLLVQAAAVILAIAWVRDVTQAPEMLGLMAVAFALGMVGLNVRSLAFTLGALAGGATLFMLLADRPPALLLVVAAAFVAGAATASVTPPVESAVGRIGYLGIPLGTAVAAWALGQVTLFAALGIAAGLYLVALLVPVFAFRAWRQLLPDAPLLPSGPAKLPGRLTVTLVYANGQWLAEVRKGRALLGSRHLVRSTEALNMLAQLDVPGVQASVESALSVDQLEAARQAERMRNELSELESKLANLNEMAEISDLRKSSTAS